MTTTRNARDVAEHAIGERGELILRLESGRLDVTAVDGEVATIRELDGRDLGERFVVERSEGRLSLRPRDHAIFDIGRGRRGRGNARLAAEVPRNATISLDTASGELNATGLRGEQRYRTASGDITIADVSGPIAIDAVSGEVRVEATGPVELSGRLVSGDLAVRGGTLRSLALATTSGDIELGSPIDGPGPFSIQSVSGDASVVMAGDGLRVEAQTLTGDISSAVGHHADSGMGRRALVVGDGAMTLAFKSLSGDLQVSAGAASHARDGAVPAPPAPAMTRQDAPPDPMADLRLDVLRDLEAGRIDIAVATERLADLDEPTNG